MDILTLIEEAKWKNVNLDNGGTYILSNIHMPGFYKVGSSKSSPLGRMWGYATYSALITDWRIHALAFKEQRKYVTGSHTATGQPTNIAQHSEKRLMSILDDHHVKNNTKCKVTHQAKEWYATSYCPLDIAIDCMKELHIGNREKDILADGKRMRFIVCTAKQIKVAYKLDDQTFCDPDGVYTGSQKTNYSSKTQQQQVQTSAPVLKRTRSNRSSIYADYTGLEEEEESNPFENPRPVEALAPSRWGSGSFPSRGTLSRTQTLILPNPI